MLSKEVVSNLFSNFSEKECKNSSKLYEFLSLKISKDNELLEICLNSRNNQPIPNSLFGAVHYLLLKGKEHKLKAYYPSIVSEAKPYNESFDYFKDFCLIHKNEINSILETKLVQTNEVRRCAYLYPVFSFIFEETKKPLALIEIGTSAGLQLLWDNYSYSYNTGEVVGDKNSKLNISSEIIGGITPFLPLNPPPISTRIGIDLNIVDLNDYEEYLWLKSLIWPEHKERLKMFESAASYIKDYPVQLIEGDGVTLLREIVENVPKNSSICIFHTHVANQMPLEIKELLLNNIESIGLERDVFHIYNNIQDRNLHLDYFLNGVEHKQTIAETDGHGRWFKWLLQSELKIK
ncbi:DUF2332 domain-containing protein [Bacillus sp. J37]|uniref:DUF2332 domain-containing protein n=1 Tax=Bacillus sp. J37 TaxID=935837 RepID=UPI00047C93C7|nr:DUF2332 domain-containing protein [Bacillus sp. J37]HWK21449.1 DUF2332 domain-containing protein [Ureibacillus sp.]